MPPRPRRCTPRTTPPRSADGPAWAPAAAAPQPTLTVSARTAAEAAHGVFQDALRDLGPSPDGGVVAGPRVARVGAFYLAPAVEPDRWGNERGPLDRPYAGGHRPSAAERDASDASEAREGARDRVYAAAGAYALALRREGVGLPAALVAVRTTVAADAAGLPWSAHAAMQRDAARCCLEAFYAH